MKQKLIKEGQTKMRDNEKLIYTIIAVNCTKKYVEDVSFVENRNKAIRKAVAYLTAPSNEDDDKVAYISTNFYLESSKIMFIGGNGYPETESVIVPPKYESEINAIVRTELRYILSNQNTYGNNYPEEFGKDNEKENENV